MRHLFVSSLLCGSLLVAAASVGHAALVPLPFEQPLPPSNPYLAKADRLVKVSLDKVGKAPSGQLDKVLGEAFWITWGYTAPESKKRGDVGLGRTARALTERWTAELEKKPQAYWSLIPALQTVDFWRRSGRATPEELALWLKRLRPSVEACCESQNKSEWINVAPNTLHQAAAGMQLAVYLYGKVNPQDPALARWAGQARKCVRAAAKMQLPGGAFSYIRTSGPDPVYYNFDSTFLGIYYLLTGDAGAGESLRKLAGWSRSVTRCGWVTAFASPWWKHFWGTGGPFFGPEIVAGVSGDPLTAGVMEIRRRSGQNYYFMFYPMYFYNPEIKPQAVSDRCEFDANANGAALRRGDFDVEMPFRSWGDSTAGAAVSGSDKVKSCITSIILTPLRDGSAAFNRSYAAVRLDPEARRATLCGPGWIAQAITFRPVTPTYGSEVKEPSPWRRTDLWFADADGLAGMLRLRCVTENRAQRIAVWVRSSPNFTADGLKLTSPDLTLELTGELQPIRAVGDGKTVIQEAVFRPGGNRLYRPGEEFTVKVSVRRGSAPLLSLGTPVPAGAAQAVPLLRDGKSFATLFYNAGTASAEVALPAGTAALWHSAGDRTETIAPVPSRLSLAPGALALAQ